MTRWFGDPVDELVGLTRTEARARADALGLFYCDLDEPVAMPLNLSTGRVKVHHDGDRVISAVIG